VTRSGKRRRCQVPTTAAVVASLAGTMAVQPATDSNAAGVAEAFSVTAAASGVSQTVNVYVDATSTASRVVVGVYADAAGSPGRCWPPAPSAP
jgi:hypothetical protein